MTIYHVLWLFFCSSFKTNIQIMVSVRLKLYIFSFCIKKLCLVKKQKSQKKRDLFFFEKSQYCLTSVFDIPINLVLAVVSLLTGIHPPGSKQCKVITLVRIKARDFQIIIDRDFGDFDDFQRLATMTTSMTVMNMTTLMPMMPVMTVTSR